MPALSELIEPNFSGSPEMDRYFAYNGFDTERIMTGDRRDKLTTDGVENTIYAIHAAANMGDQCARALVNIAGYEQLRVWNVAEDSITAEQEKAVKSDPTAPIDELVAIDWLDTVDSEDLNEAAA